VIQRKFVSGKNAALLVFAVLQFQIPAFAQEVCRDPAGRFASIEGRVQIRGDNQEAWRAAKQADRLCRGDSIRVGEKSRAAVLLVNEAVLRLDQNTTMRLVNVSSNKEERSLLEMASGAIKSFIRKPRLLQVNTPYLNGSVEGTEFQVSVAENAASILVLEGRILASNDQGKVTINPGEIAEAQAGAAPTSRLLVKPRDAVQWTLFYPPIQATSGDAPTNLEALDKVAESDRDAAWHINRASLLLSVGRQDEALASIDAAVKLDPKAGQAHALRSIIHTVRNERPQALAEAEKGVALTDNASTRIALSYAQQADFQLEAARDTLLVAVQNNPDDALAWARLSELWLMLGNRRDATAAAEKAVKLQPGLGRTQSVLGFAALAEIRTAQAQAAFEQAIALESADPLAHLGLGLARIRQGHLAEGRAGLETAVALDSNNALLRAYLGKAYFEEKRGPLDAQQLAVAKELDPLDPTAYFYDAIRLQTENRPVEALQELEASMERNDNRAVFRSRLLLDQDRAARGASLARVYSDLGFQALALVEGWKSVNTDPGNYSAHRFLADSYSALPRHEIARVSELLQSQLLAPVTNTPLQPRLAESNLGLISSGGPGTASFNEFNPLFNRDGISALLTGMAGEQNTAAGDAVVSGIVGRAGFSVGYSKFKTDGFRVNADQDDEFGNAFFQFDLTPQTSLQAEYRHRKTEWGDTKQRFFTDAFSSSLRNTEESDTYRLGARHTFSPESTLIGSFVYQNRDTTATFSQPPDFGLGVPGVDGSVKLPDEQAGSAELQHLFRSNGFNLRSGVGYFNVDRTEEVGTTLVIPLPSPPLPPGSTDRLPLPSTVTDAETKHLNAYAYGTLLLARNVNVILGASYDSINGELDSEDKDQFNPKLGLIWNVTPATTIRAAAFSVVKRTLITDQTLEPTEVAGFNQFYDDANLTESRRYGAAVDQKFSSSIFGGLEFSKRDLTVPWTCVMNCAPVGAREADWEERLSRAYAFWTPHPWWALRAEYIFEQFKRDPEFTGGAARDLDSHRAPLGVRFFHPSGVSAGLTTTYWNQKGDFGDANMFQSGSEKFWTVDAALSYRLPGRKGFITAGATNLFDEEFRYLDTDERNPTIQPARMAFVRVSLTLP
jgi:tetratricopeptide (TPR) repeat protein